MATKRMITTSFWDDKYICSLKPEEKLLFLYALTSSASNICGIYEVNIERIKSDTGISSKKIESMFIKFAKDEKIYYCDGYLIIKNFIKHQSDSPKVVSGILRSLSQLPPKILSFIWYSLDKSVQDTLCIQYGYSIDTLSDLTKLNLTKLNLTKLNLTKPNLTSDESPDGDSESVSSVDENGNILEVKSESERLARYLHERIKNNNIPISKKMNFKKWANEIRLLKENAKCDWHDIEIAIDIAQDKSNRLDRFCPVINSAGSLRDKFSRIIEYQKRKAKNASKNDDKLERTRREILAVIEQHSN